MYMIAGTTADHVAMINNPYEYPEYLRVVSSQLFYNRVLHKGSWQGRINWAPKGDQVFQPALLVFSACSLPQRYILLQLVKPAVPAWQCCPNQLCHTIPQVHTTKYIL